MPYSWTPYSTPFSGQYLDAIFNIAFYAVFLEAVFYAIFGAFNCYLFLFDALCTPYFMPYFTPYFTPYVPTYVRRQRCVYNGRDVFSAEASCDGLFAVVATYSQQKRNPQRLVAGPGFQSRSQWLAAGPDHTRHFPLEPIVAGCRPWVSVAVTEAGCRP